MKNLNELNYEIKKDIEYVLYAEKINLERLSKAVGISKTTLNEILKSNVTNKDVCEKFYSYFYNYGYRFNLIKEQFLKENDDKDLILFHGSKNGLSNIDLISVRDNCDFGKGFYLGETYHNSASFVFNFKDSSIYSFSLDISSLKIKKLDFSLEWMIAICYFRKTISFYENNEKIKEIIDDLNNYDLIIAPIADNKMFHIMNEFAKGKINIDVAMHSLRAFSLGNQYVLKSEKAIKLLKPIEKYYLSIPERNYLKQSELERGNLIDTKLKMSMKEYQNGKFIEDLFK